MEGNVKQSVAGSSNIQAGRDIIVKVFRSRSPHAATVSRVHARILYALLVALLLGTTLPNPLVNIASSIGAALMWLAWSLTARQAFKPTVLVAAAFSILTGCAGPFFADLKPPLIVCDPGQSCKKIGYAQGIGILGFGLEEVTAINAKENGGLKKVYASQEIRGYGLISMAKVRVYGE
jgi:hypothetical protein